MKLKLDENLPNDLGDALTRRGHDVETVLDEGLAGADDAAVLRASTDADRLLLTLDRGFGDVRANPPGTHPGIVVLRPMNQDVASIHELVDRFLELGKLEDLRGCTVVVEPERIRIRRPDSQGLS